jgi:capsular polysaccharide biosynthesis protein
MKILSSIQSDIDFDIKSAYQEGPVEDCYELNDIGGFTKIHLGLNKHGAISFSLHRCIEAEKSSDRQYNDVLLLNMPFFDNYGHCLHDVIPKLLHYDKFSNVDVIYASTSPLMQSLLNLFEIKFNKVILLKHGVEINPKNIRIENHPAFHIRDKNKVRLLKDIIDERASKNCDNQNKKSLIYCTRNTSSDVGGGRLMKQSTENEIVSLLKDYSQKNKLNFVLFNGQENGKTMSHKKQMQLFNTAKIVVGPHGSAMANVIYCNPKHGVKICEFTSGTEVQVHGPSIFYKHYNALNGFLLQELYDYYLIPFDKSSNSHITSIDLENFKVFMQSI